MKSPFDQKTNRFQTHSLKWDVPEHELPMWVADMDFETAPTVKKAIEERATQGIYGYSIIPDAFFESIRSWWERRHHVQFQKEWMIYSSGVVAAISSIVRKITTVGENVLIQSPVYNIFYHSILNNGRNVLTNDLIYENGIYHIDFDDLEKKLADPQTSLMILCNPHNPIGKCWTKDELAKIGELCYRHHVKVISDEIHCDIVDPQKSYVPFASVNDVCRDISITCLSCSKVFNLAGLQSACLVVPNPYLHHQVWRGLNTDEVAEPNCFSMQANIVAFQTGEAWVRDLNAYLYENKQLVSTFIAEELPHLYLVPSEATYLLWIDISYYSEDSADFCHRLRKETGLYLCPGIEYGKNGDHFVRMNIATQRDRVKDGLARLKRFLKE